MSRDTLRNLNNDSGLERRLHEIFKRRMADVEARALGGGRQLAVKTPRSKSAKPPLQDFFAHSGCNTKMVRKKIP